MHPVPAQGTGQEISLLILQIVKNHFRTSEEKFLKVDTKQNKHWTNIRWFEALVVWVEKEERGRRRRACDCHCHCHCHGSRPQEAAWLSGSPLSPGQTRPLWGGEPGLSLPEHKDGRASPPVPLWRACCTSERPSPAQSTPKSFSLQFRNFLAAAAKPKTFTKPPSAFLSPG